MMLSRFCKLCNVLLFICYASSLSLLSSQNPCFLAQLYSELGGGQELTPIRGKVATTVVPLFIKKH